MSMDRPSGFVGRAKRQVRGVGMLFWGLGGIVVQVVDRIAAAAVRPIRRWLTIDDRDHQTNL